MLRIETGLVLIALLIAFIRPTLGSSFFEKAEKLFSRLARQRSMSVVLVGAVALVLRAAMLPIEPIPEPLVHDEFGYLLAADTFAHGRLTNPTPPMWEHFETFSVLMKPTYQCFAQPAQGLILAFGKIFFGHPFWGVWLSAGVMCAAITWMLQAWLPPEWAVLGGMLAIVRLTVLTYWDNSYWGGAAGAIGGALVLGALPRIRRSLRSRDAVLMGLGLAILANSRPYEGMLVGVPVAVALFAWIAGKNRSTFVKLSKRVVGALSLVLIASGISMGYYFWRVTGHPFQMPYQQERVAYGNVPLLLWQHKIPSKTPIYHSEALRQLYVEKEVKLYQVMHTMIGFVYVEVQKLWSFWRFYIGPALTLPLLALLFALPYGFSFVDVSRPTKFVLALVGFCALGMSAELYFEPHYAAPLAGVALFLVLKASRVVRTWGLSAHPTGLFLTRSIPIICALMFLVRVGAAASHEPLPEANAPAWSQQSPPSFGRARIEAELRQLPGKDLVIVHYGKLHNPFEEWVYNDADIDNAEIVWAREINPTEDQRVIEYFHNRKIWLLEADARPPLLKRCIRDDKATNSIAAVCGSLKLSAASSDPISPRQMATSLSGF